MTDVLVYPMDLRITGHPARHGVADLAITVDINSANDIHLVVTTDQLTKLHRDIAAKLSEHSFTLVTEQVSHD